jgi:hypothetical protein
VVIIGRMSDDKPKPVDDLKEGLGLLLRAARGAVEKLPTEKLEDVAKDAAKEVSRAFESLGNEIDRAFGKTPAAPSDPTRPVPTGQVPPAAEAKQDEAPKSEAPKSQPQYDDGYAPEPPKGPRIG